MENFEIKHKKEFMNNLLLSNKFDDFLLKEAVIKTATTFTIDGMENRDFYENDEDVIMLEAPYDYVCWSKIKPIILSFIKGKRTPVSMKMTLYLKPDLMESVLGENMGVTDYLIINLHFNALGMNITTGIAYKEFTLDKAPDSLWDKYVALLLDEA